MSRRVLLVAIVAVTLFIPACSKRQVLPATLAGVGVATFASGVTYRFTLPEKDSQDVLGRQPEQKAITATLVLAGAALVTAGVVWSATTPVCESDGDCWVGDRCETATQTCVPAPPASLERPAAAATSLELSAPSAGLYVLTLSRGALAAR